MLQDFGRIDGARPGNKLRDMQRLLGKRGFMPNIPVSQIEKVPGLFIGRLFLIFFEASVFVNLIRLSLFSKDQVKFVYILVSTVNGYGCYLHVIAVLPPHLPYLSLLRYTKLGVVPGRAIQCWM